MISGHPLLIKPKGNNLELCDTRETGSCVAIARTNVSVGGIF